LGLHEREAFIKWDVNHNKWKDSEKSILKMDIFYRNYRKYDQMMVCAEKGI
jgi:hypothetical protein